MASAPIKENYTKTIEGVLNCEEGTIEVQDYGTLNLIELLRDKFDGEYLKISVSIKKGLQE